MAEIAPRTAQALDLPFFEASHRDLATRIARFVEDEIEPHAAEADAGDADGAGRRFLQRLAHARLLELFVPDRADRAAPDLRTICLVREALASASGVADSVYAVHGLGTFPIVLAGGEAIREEYLPAVIAGRRIGAFALTEPDAGSDIAAIATTARPDGDTYILDGRKTLISNAGIADFYVVFAAMVDRPAGARPELSGFIVKADARGLRVTSGVPLLAPHPIGDLTLENCRVPRRCRLGEEGDGFRIALTTLDFFRATVGAAACGMAGRALRDAWAYGQQRRQFGSPIAEFQSTQFALADMETELEAARLLVYRAAWLKDNGSDKVTREASMAKLFATEMAQRVVDRAVQIHGGVGVRRGTVVERLYREVRALRIYEGTSEIQRLIIANEARRRG